MNLASVMLRKGRLSQAKGGQDGSKGVEQVLLFFLGGEARPMGGPGPADIRIAKLGWKHAKWGTPSCVKATYAGYGIGQFACLFQCKLEFGS